jgi:hypothetical protein
MDHPSRHVADPADVGQQLTVAQPRLVPEVVGAQSHEGNAVETRSAAVVSG